MSTKYSVPKRSQWAHKTGLYISDHCAQRWLERTPHDAIAPETAVERAVADSFVVGHPDIYADRVYIYAPADLAYGAVFIREDRYLKTVCRIEGYDDPALRAYLWTRAKQARGDEGD